MRRVIATVVCSFFFLGCSEAIASPGDDSGSALVNSKEGAALKAWRTKQHKGSGGAPTRRTTNSASKQRHGAVSKQQTDSYLAYLTHREGSRSRNIRSSRTKQWVVPIILCFTPEDPARRCTVVCVLLIRPIIKAGTRARLTKP